MIVCVRAPLDNARAAGSVDNSVSIDGTTHRPVVGERKHPKRWRCVGVRLWAHWPMAPRGARAAPSQRRRPVLKVGVRGAAIGWTPDQRADHWQTPRGPPARRPRPRRSAALRRPAGTGLNSDGGPAAGPTRVRLAALDQMSGDAAHRLGRRARAAPRVVNGCHGPGLPQPPRTRQPCDVQGSVRNVQSDFGLVLARA